MILNLDLNPYINKICSVDNISIGEEIKSNFSNYTPGGNVVISNFLNAFGEDSFLTGFLGGFNGERYHQMLLENNTPHEFIQIKDESRVKSTIRDHGENIIKIIDQEPRVTREDTKKLRALYVDILANTEVVCGSSNTLPLGLTEEIYFDLISLAKQKDKRFILEARGPELKRAIDASPYMVVLDKERLEDLINISFQYENEIIKAANYILHRGVEFVVICMTNSEILLLGQEKGYRISSSIGVDYIDTSNLSRVSAAFALGIRRSYDLDMTSRLAYAFNLYESLEGDLEEIDLSEIKRIMAQVEISSIAYA